MVNGSFKIQRQLKGVENKHFVPAQLFESDPQNLFHFRVRPPTLQKVTRGNKTKVIIMAVQRKKRKVVYTGSYVFFPFSTFTVTKKCQFCLDLGIEVIFLSLLLKANI